MANILLVNDDGIQAPGLAILARIMAEHGRLYVLAPHSQQSAIGHGITIHHPIRLHTQADYFDKLGIAGTEHRAWSLEAKPADCVKFALFGLNLEIDLVVSGINEGPNLGTDIIYSGTLAGASEGVICGLPAIALSSDFSSFELAERELPGLMARVLAADILSADRVININFPMKHYQHSLGIRICDMGKRPFLHNFELEDGLYWARGTWGQYANEAGSDVRAYEEGYIAITPIQINRTDYSYMEVLRQRLRD